MSYQLYGFLIGKDIHFDIEHRQVYRLSSNGTEKNLMFGTVFFSETMFQLFLYMLNNARGNRVSKDELLVKIWEDKKLSSSPQRLWQVLNGLNKKLMSLGLPDGFIATIRGAGYTVNYKEITPLYYRVSELPIVINDGEFV
ncbi:helix-turn-helix domain-containing protein [Buttiauxella sp. B2]|uniref:winged helix-turn-helix domain-containing protein n=1 Tax=Buttiauxella sp. B2 TaxID=2587812 RepID=UPI00111DE18E|nr:winged helix-turn-helix domain-containing protein [Buttiauxella sp. B2]TNV20480.1 helix-turn-helix domain-containing protein [Buttiauxella sp. B2]